MMYLLPAPTPRPIQLLSQLLKQVKGFFKSKKNKFKLAAVLDIVLIAAILFNAKHPAKELISPLVSPAKSFYAFTHNISTPETFAFVPDLARNKFPYVDTHGLTYLSFFDVPLDKYGGLNYYSKGYASFSSTEAQELFDRARQTNTNVFLTVSAIDQDIIANLLNDPNAQQNLAQQLNSELQNSNISGITIDFEYPHGKGKDYQTKFTNFIKVISDNIHQNSPDSRIAVAIPSELTNNQSLYNMEGLGKASDRIFLIASNFIVPETRNANFINPVFGYNEYDYFKAIAHVLSSLKMKVSSDKVVMEKAWYGNGDNYPLYQPEQNPPPVEQQLIPEETLDKDTVDRLVIQVPDKAKQAARKNIPIIAKALEREGILNTNILAYALATIEHETDETFEPIEEIQGRINARRYGYEGGTNYFGRGFIQITHLRNYREFGNRIGLGDALVRNPELATDPEIAAKILAAYFKDNNVANLASQRYYTAARTPINPDYNGYSVAQKALKYEI